MATRAAAVPNRKDRRDATKQLVSVQVGAEYLDVTTKSIRNWIAQGRLTGYRVGRLIKVDLAEVDALATPIPTAKAG